MWGCIRECPWEPSPGKGRGEQQDSAGEEVQLSSGPGTALSSLMEGSRAKRPFKVVKCWVKMVRAFYSSLDHP